eukprot:Gb_25817 [translate_table: standard]
MAEAVVGALIEALLHKVAQEANVVISFKNNFQWLSEKLEDLKGFLKDADGKSRHNRSVNNWLHKIEDVAYDAEDILEECLLAESDADLRHCYCSYTQFLFRYRMGRRIKDVKDRIKSIHEDAEELKLYNDASHQDQTDDYTRISAQTYREKSSLLSNESQRVGIEEKIETIIGWLNDPQTRVIAVVGMAGLGKTFLLHHVFQRAKGSFSNSIWLSIFQDYSVKQLQCDICQKIGLSELKDVSVEAAAESIHGRLQRQRSLIVLDDVWREDDLVRRIGMPDERNCKIVISSRMREVCTTMGSRVYDMELLSEENSWKLLCFHAFPDCGQTPPQEVEEVARAIEKKCGRLPLAVTTVAAAMASIKRLPNEWNFRLRRLMEVVIADDIRPILRLSYDALPAYLKQCFVYCSAFPEDSEIDVDYVINLWIAEGFIQTENKEDIMGVALSYVKELTDRCLIEVSERSMVDSLLTTQLKIAKRLRMHDLLRDLSLSLAKESKCVFDGGKGSTQFLHPQETRGQRRISLRRSIPLTDKCPGLRTLLLTANRIIEDPIPARFIGNLKSLRVLDLSSTGIISLPESIENLKLLRFLNISHTKIRKLPNSVRGLKSLQYLDVSFCDDLEKLPEEIRELHCLKHLDATHITRLKSIMPYDVTRCRKLDFMPKGISELTSLETLRGVEFSLYEKNNILRIEDLKGLIQLRDLQLTSERELDVGSMIEGLVKMRTLCLHNASENKFLQLSDKMASLTELEHLRLEYYSVVPNFVCSFKNCLVLILYSCNCTDYPALETLLNLRILLLQGNRCCLKLRKEFGKSGGFPKLERLGLFYLTSLEEFPKLEDGAMPCLKTLRVWRCGRLKKRPDGIERLNNLEQIHVDDCGGWETMKAGEDRAMASVKSLMACMVMIMRKMADGTERLTIVKGGIEN